MCVFVCVWRGGGAITLVLWVFGVTVGTLYTTYLVATMGTLYTTYRVAMGTCGYYGYPIHHIGCCYGYTCGYYPSGHMTLK